jgi:hypothetical protein
MRSMRIQTEYHPCLAMRTLRCLSAKEPFRVLASNLDLDNKFSTNISRIVLSKSSVKFLVAVARVPKITLSQCMVKA